MSRYDAAPTLQVPSLQIALEVVSINALALLLTHLLRAYMKRRRWHTLRIAALVPRALVASVVLGFPIAAIMSFLSIAMMWGGGPEDQEVVGRLAGEPGLLLWRMDLLLRTLNWSAAFAFWIGLYFGITSVRDRHRAELRQSELAHALKVAELRVLKSQLNPHFLFNSLNSVRALIADDPARAQVAVTQLAKTLRYTLTSNQDELVTLAHEMEIVDDYLAIEALRLGERLKIERDISADAARTRIP